MDISNTFPVIIALTIAVGITFIIAAIQESKHGLATSDVVRRIYLYLVSFVTLLGLTLGLIGVLNVGLRSWVFTKATFATQSSTPPVPYLVSKAPAGTTTTPLLTCTNGCTLSQEQKDSLTQWENEYRVWKNATDEKAHRASQLITALSFLIIALVVFIPHWMLAKRDRHESGHTTPLRVTYLWAVSFVMLVAGVVAGGFLLNTTLKSVFLKTGTDTNIRSTQPVFVQQTGDVDSIVTCGATCGVDPVTVTHAQEWRQAYDASLAQTPQEQEQRNRHNLFALTIAAILATIPLFVYHFLTVWKETKTPHSRKKS